MTSRGGYWRRPPDSRNKRRRSGKSPDRKRNGVVALVLFVVGLVTGRSLA
jgi:hypothetical protein